MYQMPSDGVILIKIADIQTSIFLQKYVYVEKISAPLNLDDGLSPSRPPSFPAAFRWFRQAPAVNLAVAWFVESDALLRCVVRFVISACYKR